MASNIQESDGRKKPQQPGAVSTDTKDIGRVKLGDGGTIEFGQADTKDSRKVKLGDGGTIAF
jgi:hypothetical protein